MSEEEFCTYAEWAETDFIWGKGQYNWRWAFVNPPPEDEQEMKKYEGLFSF